MAAARLTIVCSDDDLIASAGRLTDLGKQMRHAAKPGPNDEWDAIYRRDQAELERFVAHARTAARHGRTI